MSVSVFDKRPPYVQWEEREMGINVDATAAAGRPIPRVVNLALITAAGSKDCHEAVADEWLAKIKRQALAGEYSTDWLKFFELSYEEWKKGNVLPREGTPIKTWAMATNEARKRLIAIGLTTVEDLAAVPDSTVTQQIGLDGRYLRDMARGWINEAKDKGANAKALADANVEIERLKDSNAQLLERVDRLAARLEAREQERDEPRRGPGRPRKSEEAAA
jgi:hypothetical protein